VIDVVARIDESMTTGVISSTAVLSGEAVGSVESKEREEKTG
jgi:hypothetical protein